STGPQTEDVVASTGSDDKPLPPKGLLKAPLPTKAPVTPVFAVKASAKVIDPAKPVEKPVMVAKVPPKTVVEPKPAVVEAKAVVEPEVKAAAPAIEVKASVSAVVSVSPSAAAEARAMIEVKKPSILPEPVSRK